MKYQGSLPDHNDNVSHNSPLREFFILLMGLLGVVLLAYLILGLSIDLAVNYISPETEAKIFSTIQPDLLLNSKTDGEEQENLQKIMDELRQCAGISYPIKVRIISSQEKNAMAFPGGNVLVFSGLLKMLQSKNGITFVLAHELGHFQNRDHLRGMGRGIVFVALSALITGTNSDLTSMLTPTSTLSYAQYSQTRESLADEAALQGLQCVHGHVGGATEFFEAISREQGRSKMPFNHYFGSHPEILQRIETIKANAKKLGFTTDHVIYKNKDKQSSSP